MSHPDRWYGAPTMQEMSLDPESGQSVFGVAHNPLTGAEDRG